MTTMRMKSNTLLVSILVLQAVLVMGIAFAVAAVDDPTDPGKFRCCNNCKDEFSGLISCGDVHSRCHPACQKCQEVKTNGPVKQYKCADLYFGNCGHPCKHRN